MKWRQTGFKNSTTWNRNICKFVSSALLSGFLLLYIIQVSGFASYLFMRTAIHKKLRNNKKSGVEEIRYEEMPFEGEKLIHFDLKGAPPKISYLLELIPFIKKLGATGLLLEYEDTFPYHSGLEGVTALNAYTLSDISAIIETARVNNLMVIPLIPTFGHFEFVLKHEQYKELREVKENPQVLCPSQEKVYSLLKKMIDQVLEVHKTSKYLHIGCDEVHLLGLCNKCQTMIKTNKWRKDHLYFGHIKKIAEYITTAHPGVKPIVWSDKFLKQNERIIAKFEIPQLVEVMFWNYRPEGFNFPSKGNMLSYQKMFKDIWIASAFKGAQGKTKMTTNIRYHLRNTDGWVDFVRVWKAKLNFKGIVLTGWQRYDHFQPLCELLPVGIPSMAFNLHYLENLEDMEDHVQQILNCNKMIPVNLEEIRDDTFLSGLKCGFPGFEIYLKIHYYYIIVFNLKKVQKNVERRGTVYNLTLNTTNPELEQQLTNNNYSNFLLLLQNMEEEIKIVLAEVYDDITINEWITTHVEPVQLRLRVVINTHNAIQYEGVTEASADKQLANKINFQ